MVLQYGNYINRILQIYLGISNVTVHGGPLRDDVSTLYLVAGGDPISNVAVKRNNRE